MDLKDLGSVASILNTVGVGAILFYIVNRFESGKYVRGSDLEECRREVARLHRYVERRLGLQIPDDLEDDPITNGAQDVRPSRRT